MVSSLDKKVSMKGFIYSAIAFAVVGTFAYFANFPMSKSDDYATQERNVTDNSDDYLNCGG